MIQIHLSDLKAARVRASRREAGPARPGVTVLVGDDWPWTGLSDLKAAMASASRGECGPVAATGIGRRRHANPSQ